MERMVSMATPAVAVIVFDSHLSASKLGLNTVDIVGVSVICYCSDFILCSQ